MEMLTDEKIIELGKQRIRKWGKAFAVFLVLMWIFTIVSRAVYISKLPHVTTQTPEKRYIEHTVEADGIVVTGGECAVNTLSGLRVSSINVQEGDYVEKDTLLFTIDLNDLTDIINSKEAELTRLQCQLSDTQFNQTIDAQKKEVSIIWAQEDFDVADQETQLAIDRAIKALQDAQTELNEHLSKPVPKTSDSDREAEWANYNDWRSQGYSISDQITEKMREIDDLEEQLQQTETEISEKKAKKSEISASEEYDEKETDLEECDKAITELSGKKSELEEKIKKSNDKVDSLNDDLTSHEREAVLEPDYSEEELAYDAWQKTRAALEDAVYAANNALEDACYARNAALRQKARDLASAQVTSPADSTAALYGLQISQLNTELSRLYGIKNKNGEIKAENDGFISKILLTVGGRTTDTAAIMLTDASVPTQFKFSITKEQGRYLHLNDTFELKLNGALAPIEATADYYTQNAAGGYDIICKLPENTAQVGTSGTITRKVQGDLQNLTIPADAVHTDQNQTTYVYILNESSGILGSEYHVTSLKVEIKDKNNTYAALSEGAVSGGTQIITSYTDEITQGAAVRKDD